MMPLAVGNKPTIDCDRAVATVIVKPINTTTLQVKLPAAARYERSEPIFRDQSGLLGYLHGSEPDCDGEWVGLERIGVRHGYIVIHAVEAQCEAWAGLGFDDAREGEKQPRQARNTHRRLQASLCL